MCCKGLCAVRWTSSDPDKWRNDLTEKGCDGIIWYNEFEFTLTFTMLTLSRATLIQMITDISLYLAGKNTLINSVSLTRTCRSAFDTFIINISVQFLQVNLYIYAFSGYHCSPRWQFNVIFFFCSFNCTILYKMVGIYIGYAILPNPFEF